MKTLVVIEYTFAEPLQKLRTMLETGSSSSILINPSNRGSIRRSMYIVGLMLRFFDFKNREVKGETLPVSCCPRGFAADRTSSVKIIQKILT